MQMQIRKAKRLVAIAALIRYVRTRTYQPFAWYRVVLAAFVVAIYLMRR